MLDKDGFIIEAKDKVIDRSALHLLQKLNPVELMSDEELTSLPTGSFFVFDVECYVNFFFVAFKSLDNGKFVTFELSPETGFNATKLRWMLWRFCLIGFNSRNYDLPIIELAALGKPNTTLKSASDFIIKSGPAYGNKKVTPFLFEKTYGITIGRYNHIDLIEVAPLQGSLKLYAGRLHCRRMQDLPFEETHVFTELDAEVCRLYCCNDLENTELLFKELLPEINLRTELGREYGIDLRSKSDAQLAEAVINSELEKLTGVYPERPKLTDGVCLAYNVPEFVSFKNNYLNSALSRISSAVFRLDEVGSPFWPVGLGEKEITKNNKEKWVLKVGIGKSTYKLGMGGLHSNEKCVGYVANDEMILADNDVESFYPRTILNQKLFPPHLGEAFLDVYQKIVDSRIEAKKKAKTEGGHWKTKADSLKITINGSFGKLGNKYSTLYAPQLMLQVTITGQLVLLMLIEALEDIGIDVVSGNTDGFISYYPKARHEEVRKTIAEWEARTGYKTEETRYKAIYSRDVNAYVAVKDKGDVNARFLDERLGIKTKGPYSERGSALNSVLSRNPETLVCIDAMLQFIANGKPVDETIKGCKDFRRFISVRNVKGGAEKDGMYLGKVVRWYYATGEKGCLKYVLSGNKVANTDGAKPVMDMPDAIPEDLNFDWYIQETCNMLEECGRIVVPKLKQMKFF